MQNCFWVNEVGAQSMLDTPSGLTCINSLNKHLTLLKWSTSNFFISQNWWGVERFRRMLSLPKRPSRSISINVGSSEHSDPTSFIWFPFLSLGSLFHFCFPSSLIFLLFSYTQIITRLSIPLHLSFPLLHFMLDTPDPLIEQGTSSSI